MIESIIFVEDNSQVALNAQATPAMLNELEKLPRKLEELTQTSGTSQGVGIEEIYQVDNLPNYQAVRCFLGNSSTADVLHSQNGCTVIPSGEKKTVVSCSISRNRVPSFIQIKLREDKHKLKKPCKEGRKGWRRPALCTVERWLLPLHLPWMFTGPQHPGPQHRTNGLHTLPHFTSALLMPNHPLPSAPLTVST
ncbi:unnamed protein product [Cylicostephanus goldi]|uniref:Uncharacterized protein n=1 Tax=Cylicostephanus goldi TaxID=71465 RepID=A0A3P7QZN1_CYLGO|nr:unnamed protein product [Cylicostephanus goldi]